MLFCSLSRQGKTAITGTVLFLGSIALMPPPETGLGMFLYFAIIAYISSYWLRRQ